MGFDRAVFDCDDTSYYVRRSWCNAATAAARLIVMPPHSSRDRSASSSSTSETHTFEILANHVSAYAISDYTGASPK
jgi:hypothetical protein